MARPTDLEKRRELAQRAAVVLQREGMSISAARLADALGLKRPTLLYHFPTHSHVVETALEELLMEQALFVLERVSRFEHPIDQLDAQIRAVHAFHEGNEGRIVFLSQAIAASAGPRLASILERATAVFEPHRRAVAERLRKGIADGTVAPCDPDALVALVRGIIDGLMIQRVTTGLALAPVQQLVTERLLAPLKIAPIATFAPRESPPRKSHANAPPPRSPKPAARHAHR